MNRHMLLGLAALGLAAVAIANALVVAFGLGASAIDQRVIAEHALELRPALLALEVLKLIAALLWATLITAGAPLLQPGRPGQMAGYLAATLLLIAGLLGLYALLRPDPGAGSYVGIIGMAALCANGFWHVAVGRTVFRSATLPRGLAILTLVIGGLSLLPFLALVILPLSLVWAIWIGVRFLRPQMA